MAERSATPGRRTGPRAVGEYGERLVCRYLEEHGATVVDRNWRCEHGEIDVVALAEGCLVVIEVKTRTGLGFGDPLESVVPRKVSRLRRLAWAWLEAHPEHRGLPLRLDVVGVLRRGTGPVEIRHVRGVGQ